MGQWLCRVVIGDEMRQKGELGLGQRSSSIFLLLCLVVSAAQAGASAIGWGAGAVSQVRQTLIAAAAANTQWFPYTGTDCATAAATATLQPGWPGAPVAGIGATTPAPGIEGGVLGGKFLETLGLPGLLTGAPWEGLETLGLTSPQLSRMQFSMLKMQSGLTCVSRL